MTKPFKARPTRWDELTQKQKLAVWALEDIVNETEKLSPMQEEFLKAVAFILQNNHEVKR